MCCYCCECDSIFACGPSVKPKPFATVDRVTVDMPVSAAQIHSRLENSPGSCAELSAAGAVTGGAEA